MNCDCEMFKRNCGASLGMGNDVYVETVYVYVDGDGGDDDDDDGADNDIDDDDDFLYDLELLQQTPMEIEDPS